MSDKLDLNRAINEIWMNKEIQDRFKTFDNFTKWFNSPEAMSDQGGGEKISGPEYVKRYGAFQLVEDLTNPFWQKR